VSTLADISAGLATRLRTIAGLRVYQHEPDNLNDLPCAVIMPEKINYIMAAGGTGFEGTFRIALFTNSGVREDAYTLLESYIAPSGASSVRAAVYGDGTLGATVDAVIAFSIEGVRFVNPLARCDFMLQFVKGVA